MAAMIQPKKAQAIRFALLGKPAAFNTKQPEAYKKASVGNLYPFGTFVR